MYFYLSLATYDAALAKAKDAELITDVDDEEKLKKSRSERKKILFSSSSSNASTDEVSQPKKKRKEVVLTEFPKAPNASNNLQIDLTTKDNLTRSNSVNSIAASVSSIVQSVETCSSKCFMYMLSHNYIYFY